MWEHGTAQNGAAGRYQHGIPHSAAGSHGKTGEFLVEIAQTGDEVLEKVQEQEPDILIMDVILPGLDGLSALRELQELGYAPMTILTPPHLFPTRR